MKPCGESERVRRKFSVHLDCAEIVYITLLQLPPPIVHMNGCDTLWLDWSIDWMVYVQSVQHVKSGRNLSINSIGILFALIFIIITGLSDWMVRMIMKI